MLFRDEGRMEGRTTHLDFAASECMEQSSLCELLMACHQSPGARLRAAALPYQKVREVAAREVWGVQGGMGDAPGWGLGGYL